MKERRRLPRFARAPDRERAFFFLRLLVGGRSAGSARRSPPKPSPRESRRGSIRVRVFLRPRPNIADLARGVSLIKELGRNTPRQVAERKARGLRAGKAYARIDEAAKILEDTGFISLPRPCARRRGLARSAPLTGVASDVRDFRISSDEGHHRAFGPAQSAWARAPHRRAAQHHSDPRQRATRGRGREIGPEKHGSRPRGVRAGLRRRRPEWRDDRSGPRDLRYRAQAPGRSAGKS